jgi:hypothetical protein
MATRRFALVLVTAGALVVSGCDYLPFGYTPIRDIVAAPANFEGKEVKLKGQVKGIVRLPGLRAFTLQDETGQITVVTQGELPAANSDVTLKGSVRSAIIVGGQSLGLRVEETRRLR